MKFNLWKRKQEKSDRNWEWSEHPGGHERHLQRRFNNALFRQDRRLITAEELELAKFLDKQSLNSLLLKVIEFNNSQPDDLPVDWQHFCNETREKVDALFSDAYKTGGDIDYVLDILTRYRKRAISSWKAGIANDSVALSNLETAELENRKYDFLDNVFVNHTANRSYIPIDELVPALLCESISTVRTYCKYLVFINDENPIKDLLTIASGVVSEASSDQLATPTLLRSWKEKLEVINACQHISKKDVLA